MYYTQEDLNRIEVKNTYYMPDTLLKSTQFKTVRLEAKLAYAAVLNTALKDPQYDASGYVYVDATHQLNIDHLKAIANKKVDQEKMNGYYKELENLGLLEIKDNQLYLTKNKGIL